ncbi:hypothetical protein SAMN05421504_103744 [Amycolatopsis xylanica]|uniref:Uncharacterized protein n=1 Tax=Amycolatopsis xylanica TaxID=589385 RepID=A0A1H3EC85_9PSEU|nr:hypothetical protein [Amycolatopsis xylanica]SDX76200.1 hypothetical protein SAMN05421504_103744 [Amycolatopsis xylanica]
MSLRRFIPVLAGAAGLGLLIAPLANASTDATGTFRYDGQTITNPVDGHCYQLTSGTAGAHRIANATNKVATLSSGASCLGPRITRVAPGTGEIATQEAYGSVIFR